MNEGTDRRAHTEGGSSGDRGPVALVMDVGGNWTRAALVSRPGEVIWRERTPTGSQEGRIAVIARVEALLHRGISHAGDSSIAGVGIGVASPLNPKTGIMYSPPNIPSLDGVSFKSLWETKLGWPVLVANDATLAALGEYHYGAGSGADTLVYLTISTGIGGGIVANGRLLVGAYGMAGEFGHMTIDRNGPTCKCGNVGCLEAIASGTSIAETAQRLVKEKDASMIADMVSGDLSRISAETVFEAAARGDSVASGILEDVSGALGAALVNILHIFNPDCIVIGGGVSQNWSYLQPAVSSYIKAYAMSHVQRMGFKLLVSSLGDDIGLLGAAALVWQDFAPENLGPNA